MITTIVVGFVVMMLAGVPIMVLLMSLTALVVSLHTSTPLRIIPEQLFNALDSFVLLAVPFFILAGSIMSKGTIAKRLIAFINSLVGWVPGGLAVAGVGACVFFAAISGSGMATIAAIGGIMLPALKDAGYDRRFSLGLLTTAGSLGIVIPPSIPMILYCLVMNTSVAEMFMAGIMPGLLIGLLLAGWTLFLGYKKNWRVKTKPSIAEVVRTGREGFWAIMLPVVVLGGIYAGVFTATEAAAVSVVYSILVEVFIHRDCTLRELPDACLEACVLSSSILILLAGALTFNWLLTAQQIPANLAQFILSHIDSPWMFLFMVNILLLLLGCVMDSVSAVMVLAPLFMNTLQAYNIDLIHFGVIMILNMEFGMLTPPFGLNLFVAMGISGERLEVVGRAVIPFLLLLLASLAAITYIPDISLFLPKLFLR
ncbi:MAG: C4-dicarboxylate ABC transporter permease [Deltaproteobacteria bacterium]|nr:MAG: C4-dicarboxylate ABC transporter permease [Deltaproteobacteria bacterium]